VRGGEPLSLEKIRIKGARQHNLKNIDLEIPRNKLVVITGLSGSGKSSLAFDTIYAEGQRRYIESLSAYARQFLEQMNKPDVEYIEGLSPAISIEQRTAARNPRSTVATVTEIHDYLRLLYARIGLPHCPKCGRPIQKQTVQQIVDQVLEFPEGRRIQILAPVVRGKKGEHRDVLAEASKAGFVRVRIDGKTYELPSVPKLDKKRKHTIEIVVDRLVVKAEVRGRLADSLQQALHRGNGLVIVDVEGEGPKVFSEHLACPDCGVSLEELAPRMFSFNSPYGACKECSGLGSKMELDLELVIPDWSKSINQKAIAAWSDIIGMWYVEELRQVAAHYGFSPDVPLKRLSKRFQEIILHGSGEEAIQFVWESASGRSSYKSRRPFEGVISNLGRRHRQTSSEGVRQWIERFMRLHPCPACKGLRLRPESLAVTVAGRSIAEVCQLSVSQGVEFFSTLPLSPREHTIADRVLREIRERLGFMRDVGLEYLTLDRATGTLSGGEAQRIHLATQIGSSLVGVLYVLDEPSIGLHQRDNRRLIDTLTRLRDLGNTVIVVEHDEETIRSADFVIDLGPGAGIHGGYVVAVGPPDAIIADPSSLTGQYLAGAKAIPLPAQRRNGNGKMLVLKGARANNLKRITVRFPLGVFICITGVSGSGKSTLVDEILHKELARRFYGAKEKPGPHDALLGTEHIDKVIIIDQSPIGRTPRSNPATYTNVFSHIRDLFSKLPESRARGYRPGRFSFNVKGGRCEACEGDGIIKLEMHFLPDVYVPCEVCKGRRYNRETLEITYKGRRIADVLDLTVEEALTLFENIPRIRNKLQTLADVGLGYITLGQSATTLSGGEAQRVKLSAELSRRATGRTLYILDEPTTGLHFDDMRKLLEVLGRLVDTGNTVLVIEHNMDVIKTADHIIDLGPEGGEAGGEVVVAGTPEDVARHPKSYTGQFLRRVLSRAPAAPQETLAPPPALRAEA